MEADLALLHEVRLVGEGEGEVHRLLDEDDRGAAVAQGLDDVEQLGDDGRRQPEGELVDHEQARPADERHAEREHLLLAARQVAGGLVQPVTQDREVAEDAFGRFADLVLLAALEPAGEAQVLGHRQRREHALPAGHLRDATRRDLVRRGVGHVAPVEDDGAPACLDEPGDRLQQRRLAGAVRPEERDDLALVDLEVDAEQHLHAVVMHVDSADEQELDLPSTPLVCDF